MENRGFIKTYIERMKLIELNLLSFIEKEGTDEDEFNNLIKLFNDQQISSNSHDLKLVLHLISSISNDYHRTRPFFGKIERVLNVFCSEIKKFFSNFEIFDIFKKNKRILLFLFEKSLLTPDSSIFHIITTGKYKQRLYPQYFFNEFKTFFSEKLLQEMKSSSNFDSESFEQKRKDGENDHHLCELIRNDMVTEFVDFCAKESIQLDSFIEPSIFETNSFLCGRKTSLIEYSAFFGSTQIFNHLLDKGFELVPSLWECVIHSNNSDLVRYLEQKQVKPPNGTFQFCLRETIKCHNVNIMKYVRENLFKNEKPVNTNSYFCQGLKFYNFIEFSEKVDEDQLENFLRFCHNDYKTDKAQANIFYDFCKFDYIAIVEYILKNHKSIINPENIFLFFVFFI